VRPLVVALVVLLAACSSSGDDDATPTTARPEAAPAVLEWPTAGADLANSRAALESEITEATVADLTELWRLPLPDAGGLSTVPIVVGGIAYVATASGQVHAVDVETGEPVWASEATDFNIGPFGVAVDDDHVYSLDGGTGVLALDRESGEEVWSTDVTATDSTGIDIQPIVVDGLVLVSSVPVSLHGIYAGGDRGTVYALDADTGDVVWTFDTVPEDLWGNPEVNSGGGAWYPPAVDLDRGVVYVGVANPAPFPGTPEHPNGTSRPGDNLYTDSVVALDLHTGELRWYHQVTPHDIFDRDQIHTLIADDGGVVVSAGKSGVIVGVDADDGKPMWRTEVGLHQNDDLESLDGPTEVAPGTYGGILTPPAYADGVVYTAVINAPTTVLPDEPAYFGADVATGNGELVAVNSTTGDVVWSTELAGNPLGGATVVGDLIVTVLFDGTLVALRLDDGSIVAQHDVGGSVNGWLAALGDRLLVPAGVGEHPALVALGVPD
jgi:outer membrane protein assembly factor BamB